MSAIQQPARRALGRGLAALIPTATPVAGSALRMLPLDEVHPNPTQPRYTIDPDELQSLADSIRAQGVLQPIIVRGGAGHFEIVAGERRWRAAAKAGLTEIPALVKNLSNAMAFEAALIENVQRADLDPLEEAYAYHRLVDDFGYSQERIAQSTGKSRVAVTNSLRLLKLAPELKQLLATRKLTPGHARALMTVGDPELAIKIGQEAAERNTSVRDLEAHCRKLAAPRTKTAAVSAAVVDVERRLTRALSTKVRVHSRGKQGRIEVFFHDLDQLDALLARMNA